MDWKTLFTAFGAIFLAELGDKTQVATVCFAAGSKSFWSVFAGSALALVATSFIACLAGSALNRFLPVRWVHLGAGLLFIAIGILTVIRSLRG
uniref:GDT1 family protein n=1 Tax=candidate division WOR-3 bacterium TaxID=2052148 RepID=A0A7C4CAJ4_UNCW3